MKSNNDISETKNVMKGLTAEEIKGFSKGLVRKEMLHSMKTKPHFNTLSTIVRGLEEAI